MSPLTSLWTVHGFIITTSFSFTRNLLLNLPGTPQILSLPSLQLMLNFVAPSSFVTLPSSSSP
ncbi:MAG: hypothetical protein M1331_01995 [Candidatus Marsarchaeota archaeon]|nr:hypothetical protein [Candidatus Marsarchaeota archaeon]